MTTSIPDSAWERSMAALIIRQVEAIEAWNAARRQREQLLSATARSREQLVDAARRRDSFRCTAEAIVTRTAQWLDRPPEPMARTAPLRAVLAHRQPWYATKVTAALAERDIGVVAVTDNGAQALGIVVAEQPDLLLAEEALAMLSGAQLLAEVALFAPSTITAAQVHHGDRIGAMLDAGAATVCTRRMPPEDVADQAATIVHSARWPELRQAENEAGRSGDRTGMRAAARPPGG